MSSGDGEASSSSSSAAESDHRQSDSAPDLQHLLKALGHRQQRADSGICDELRVDDDTEDDPPPVGQPAIDLSYIYSSFGAVGLRAAKTSFGGVPEWLQGSLYLVGPGRWHVDDYTHCYSHLYDALAVLQCVRFGHNKVMYRRVLPSSEALQSVLATGQVLRAEFGTPTAPDANRNLITRWWQYLTTDSATDNSSAQLNRLGSTLLATGRASHTHACIRPDNLQRQTNCAALQVCGADDVQLLCPQLQPELDNAHKLYAIGLGRSHFLLMHTTSADSPFTVIGRVPFTHRQPLLHSFSVTLNHLVFIEQPMQLSPFRWATRKLAGRSLLDCYDWLPEMQTRFHLVEKTTGFANPLSYVCVPFFCLRHVNAYEQFGAVVLDLLAYHDASILHWLSVTGLRSGQPPPWTARAVLLRFVLPMFADTCTTGDDVLLDWPGKTAARAIVQSEPNTIFLVPEVISLTPMEQPEINRELCAGLSYRFAYALHVPLNSPVWIAAKVIKTDVRSGRQTSWTYGHDRAVASQPTFVMRPDGDREDDGVLLVPVCDTTALGCSSVLLLHATSMTALCSLKMPCDRLPAVSSGLFVRSTNRRQSRRGRAQLKTTATATATASQTITGQPKLS